MTRASSPRRSIRSSEKALPAPSTYGNPPFFLSLQPQARNSRKKSLHHNTLRFPRLSPHLRPNVPICPLPAFPLKNDNGTPEEPANVHASADKQCEKAEKAFPDSIQPKGSFSGRSISAWSTPLFTGSDDDEPIRRIPSCKDPNERRYELKFTLVPLPGKKSIAYKLVFIISALYWLLFTAYAAASGDAGTGMLNIVLLVWGFVMPAIAVYISLTGNEPHIPRRLYKRPRRLCWICLAVDYLTAILVLLSLALPHECVTCGIMGVPIHWITLAIGVCVPAILYLVLWHWTRSIDVDRAIQAGAYEKLHYVDVQTD